MKARSFTLRPFALPRAEVQRLANGLTVHVVARRQLPLVSMRLAFPAGSAADPKGLEGAAELTAGLLRRGAKGLKADAIAQAVDFVAASFGGSASDDVFGLYLNAPAKAFEAMFGLFATVALTPTFAESEVALAKRRTLAHMQNDLDEPSVLADKALLKALWEGHAYGHDSSGTQAGLRALTAAHVRSFHAQQLSPGEGHLVIVGDVAVSKVMARAESLFGHWKGPAPLPRSVAPWSRPVHAGKVFLVDKPEQTQVQVRIAARGLPRGHVDQFPVRVMSGVLGGSFTSRLMQQIRVKRGLSYGARCSFDAMRFCGSFVASSFTKVESADVLTDVALHEIDLMRKKGPTRGELESIQRYICGLYPARLETNDGIAGMIADIQLNGLPRDYADTYRDRIMAVDVNEASQAAAAHLPRADTTMVWVGPAKALAKRAAKYGDVRVLKPTDLV